LKIESVKRRALPRFSFSYAWRSHEKVKAERARRSPTCRAVAQGAQALGEDGLTSLLRELAPHDDSPLELVSCTGANPIGSTEASPVRFVEEKDESAGLSSSACAHGLQLLSD
jgi:hypothetical protein